MNQELHDLVQTVNLYSFYCDVQFNYEDAKIKNKREIIGEFLDLIPEKCTEIAEIFEKQLYKVCEELSDEELEEVIRALTPGLIRSNCRTAWRMRKGIE